VAGQYAVAEVTMNRKASGRYAGTVAAWSTRKTGSAPKALRGRLFMDGVRYSAGPDGGGLAARLGSGRSGLL